MENPIINIYCDESCHLENDHHKSMVIGGISCPISKVRDISLKIRQLKEKHNMNRKMEIKWTKISPAKYDFYSDLVDLYVNEECLRFRAIKIADKKQLNHKKFHQTHNEWYYKMYYDMLRHILQPYKDYKIYVDIKDTIGCEKVCKLKDILQHTNKNKAIDVQQIRSHESELLQLADVLIGAIGYRDRINEITVQPSQSKIKLCEKIEHALGVSFDRNSRYSDQKFNLFLWEGNK
ncbi:MAG: DUF3800 domain-containing protein [Muribaculaceae bacterium]|nr:DUF3800 domain-containing protein [Muribaculaceae bacterium]